MITIQIDMDEATGSVNVQYPNGNLAVLYGLLTIAHDVIDAAKRAQQEQRVQIPQAGLNLGDLKL